MSNTKDLILITALDAFGEQGTGQVTTNNIADILDISPGNVYYYFKSKPEIIAELYRWFSKDFVGFLQEGSKHGDNPAKVWLVLSLCFQLMVKYRFIFRDANYNSSKYPELRKPFNNLINETRSAGDDFCQRLIDVGLMVDPPEQIDGLAVNLHLVFTQWISYAEILPSKPLRSSPDADPYNIVQGVQQIINLLLPYLSEDARQAFSEVQIPA